MRDRQVAEATVLKRAERVRYAHAGCLLRRARAAPWLARPCSCRRAGRAGRSLFHYPKWLAETNSSAVEGFHEYTSGGNPSALGGGDTDAPQVAHNPVDIEEYHTHWTARRTLDWLGKRSDDEPWFCWMSFPDPHHPWDVPNAAREKLDWRDLDLPAGYPGSRERCEDVGHRIFAEIHPGMKDGDEIVLPRRPTLLLHLLPADVREDRFL
mgnify:CR=1 FL=1